MNNSTTVQTAKNLQNFVKQLLNNTYNPPLFLNWECIVYSRKT